MQTLSLPRFLTPYRGLPRTVYIQLLCCLIINMGGMAKLFLPLYLHESYAVPYRWIGLMVSVYGVGALSGSYRGGSLSDRYDSCLLARIFLTLAALCLLLLSLPIPLWLFAPVLLVSGFCDGAFRPVNQRLVLEPCPVQRRPQAQGMLRVAFNLGVAVSGITGGFLADLGYHWVYLSDGLAAGLAALWMFYAYRRFPVRLEQRQGAQQDSVDPRLSPWRDHDYLRLMVGMVICTAVFDQMYSVLGLFLRQHNQLGPHWLGALFTINGLMVVFLQVPVAQRIIGWGVGRCAQWGVMLTGLSYLLLLVGPEPCWPIAMALVITAAELLMSPAVMQLVMKRSEGRLRGRYMGIYSAAWAGRTLFAPAIGTWVYGTAGSTVLWIGCALLSLLAALLQSVPIRRILQASAPTAAAPPARA